MIKWRISCLLYFFFLAFGYDSVLLFVDGCCWGEIQFQDLWFDELLFLPCYLNWELLFWPIFEFMTLLSHVFFVVLMFWGNDFFVVFPCGLSRAFVDMKAYCFYCCWFDLYGVFVLFMFSFYSYSFYSINFLAFQKKNIILMLDEGKF